MDRRTDLPHHHHGDRLHHSGQRPFKLFRDPDRRWRECRVPDAVRRNRRRLNQDHRYRGARGRRPRRDGHNQYVRRPNERIGRRRQGSRHCKGNGGQCRASGECEQH